MLKVLVANSNENENQTISRLFSESNDISIINTYTGNETLKIYRERKPGISIIDTGFKDIPYKKIINDLSITYPEIKKCNFLLTTNSEQDTICFENCKRVYQIFEKPIDYDKLLEVVNELKPQYELKEINEFELNIMLIELNFHSSSEGTKYMREAIILSYYKYPESISLEEIYSKIAKQNGKTENEIRASVRSSLNTVNKSRVYSNRESILDRYDKNYNITPRDFLDTFVAHLHCTYNSSN